MFKAIGTRLAALVLVGLAVALPAARLEAAGFALFEQGSKGNAMGGAFAATADDPSAMFYNPAGNAFIDDFTMMGGAFGVLRPTARLDGLNPYPGDDYSANMQKSLYWFGHGYLVLPLSKDLKLSAGFWSPYGLGVPWENQDTFRGRFIEQRTDLRQVAVGVQLAWKLSDAVAIGAGPEFRITDARLAKNGSAVNPFTQRVTDVYHVSLVSEGTPVDVTWAAGLLVKPCDRLRFGLSYHAHVDVDLHGHTQFGQIPSGNSQFDAAVAAGLPTAPAYTTTTLQVPSLTSFGVAYELTPKLTLEVDGNYTTWKVFDQTVLNIEGAGSQVLVHNWENAWAFRAGALYKASNASWLAAGFVYDQTPQPSFDAGPFLPDSNRTGVTIGGGLQIAKSFEVQFSSLFLWFHERTITDSKDNFSATYKTFAILPSVGFKSTF